MILNEAYVVLKKVNEQLNAIKENGCFPEEFECNYRDSEEKFKHDEMIRMIEKLDDVSSSIEWLCKEVKAKGRLEKKECGYYGIPGLVFCFFIGDVIEVWNEEHEYWVKSSIEHNGDDFYIVALGMYKNIEKVLVRIR